jgi:hypothetical protein
MDNKKNLSGKPEGTQLNGKQSYRQEDNIKKYHGETVECWLD